MKSCGSGCKWVMGCFYVAGLSATVLAASAPIAPGTIWAAAGKRGSTEIRILQDSAESKQSTDKQAGEKESGNAAQKESPKLKTEPEHGYAAFYSQSLEGHKTACGGTYSSTQLTAAHPKLRCGTKLRVTNLRNGKVVRVTVNDHGPASGGERIIDVSYAAAQALDFVKQGTTLVKVEVVR